jgi:hypothetical protein
MQPGVHRVRRQSWRVTTSSAAAAFEWRAGLRAGLDASLLPVFGEAFDAAAPGEALLRIPRLELRLRVAHLGQLAGALRDALGRELAMPMPAAPRAPALEWHDLLAAYLESGTLAWHAAHAGPAEIAAQLRAALLAGLAPLVRSRAPGASAPFARRLAFFFRLLQLLPREQWREAARHAAAPPAGASPSPSLADALAVLLAAPLAAPVVHRLAAAMFAAAQAEPAWTAAAALRDELLRILHAALPARPAAARPAGVLVELAAQLPPVTAAFFIARIDRRLLEKPADVVARPRVQPIPARPVARKPEPRPQPFALMASHAGLVLLHPFLPQLFEACGLVRGREMEQPERAAALLHWLATGAEEPLELELGFAKLLVGLRPEEPLAVGAGLLGEAERAEGEALLQAVIAHWKALGGTSVDGLRGAFLQRRGALREDGAGWRLQLEPEPLDVLLARLPWELSTVRLPWMTRPLYTDWPTP